MEGLLLAGCLVAEGEAVETGKALDLFHFISAAGAREAEVTSLQGNVRGFRGLGSLGHFEVRARNPYNKIRSLLILLSDSSLLCCLLR